MNDDDQELKAKLLSETAKMPWCDLQRFFAQGAVLQIDPKEDLIHAAMAVAADDKQAVNRLIQSGKIKAPKNDTARQWYSSEAELWCVVVAPYVLVQDRN